MADHYQRALAFASDPKWSKYVAPALLLADAVLCGLIIRTVAYTEIDWVAYMQQVKQYVAGERDYSKIYGSTGPLVYPAMHLYIYRGLYAITDSGRNITLAQVYFAMLYVTTLALVMACYYKAKAPPFIYPMLVLSKRLHSIYVLRCFNDGWAVGFLFAAIFFYQRREWTYGTFMYSLGLATKMNLLLVLPAVVLILYQALGPSKAYKQALILVQAQIWLGVPFLRRNWRAYVTRAFDLSRQFKYEWTVNWRFVPEERFLSRNFSVALLTLHVVFLVWFATTRWLQPLRRNYSDFLSKLFVDPPAPEQAQILRRVSPEFILTSIMTAMAIGMLFARSLHYQFFSWIAWGTPFLLARTKLHPALQYFVWFGQELAWNVYPSVELSSKIVVGVLAVMVIQLWVATDDEGELDPEEPAAQQKKVA